MSSDVKIPDEHSPLEIAESLITAPYEWQSDAILAVADALLAAEQRGRKAGLEEAADRAFQIMEGRLRQKAAYEVVGQKREARDFETMAIEGNYISAAIRSLGEQI